MSICSNHSGAKLKSHDKLTIT